MTELQAHVPSFIVYGVFNDIVITSTASHPQAHSGITLVMARNQKLTISSHCELLLAFGFGALEVI